MAVQAGDIQLAAYDDLPEKASQSVLGLVKIGEGVNVAEDGTISVVTGTPFTLSNKETDGSFEIGTSQTLTGATSVSIEDALYGAKSIKINPNSSTAYASRTVFTNAVVGDIIFLSCWVKLTSYTSGSPAIRINRPGLTTPKIVNTTILNQWQLLSIRIDCTGSSIGYLIGCAESGKFTAFYDGLTLLNLSEMFGRGNEPTASAMEGYIQGLGGWINGSGTIYMQTVNGSQISDNAITNAKIADGTIQRIVNWNTSLAVAPVIYGVVGKETNVYFDNLVSDDAENYKFDVAISGTTDAMQQSERLAWTPAVPLALTNMTISTKDRLYNTLQTTVLKLQAVDTSAKSGESKKALFIGDSTTAAGVYTGELVDLFGNDVMDLNLIGTQGSGLNLHEGHNGRNVSWFYSDVASPFVTSGAFNFPQYMTNNSFPSVDYVFIHLGINDVYYSATDAEVDVIIAANKTKLDAMITSFKAFNANVKIGVMTTIPPSKSQDAFGYSYKTEQTLSQYKRNIHRYTLAMISYYSGKTVQNIYVVPVNNCLDTVNNMITTSVAVNSRNTKLVDRQNNGVHPAPSGYYQMADAVYCFIKNV